MSSVKNSNTHANRIQSHPLMLHHQAAMMESYSCLSSRLISSLLHFPEQWWQEVKVAKPQCGIYK